MNIESTLAKLSSSQHLLHKFHVKEIRIFGSIARGEADSGSDVDLLVEFEPSAHIGLFEFSRLRHELSKLLGCDVDLATPDALHKEMRDEILKEAIRAA